MRLINADKLKQDIEDTWICHSPIWANAASELRGANKVKSRIDLAPTVDIIYCKECKYRTTSWSTPAEDGGFCPIEGAENGSPGDQDFCSYAERG